MSLSYSLEWVHSAHILQDTAHEISPHPCKGGGGVERGGDPCGRPCALLSCVRGDSCVRPLDSPAVFSNKVFVVQRYFIMSLATMEYVCRTTMEYRKFGLNHTLLCEGML